ncbi:VOC family protein [Neobacillus sp. SCS-31]|uniref:VOC family protein n=1 Tax=Neobacillus oceani TaxID=3115292 RepID=UPI0039059F0B
MIYEMTYQVRVSDFEEGEKWYKTLLNKGPDYTPHAGFAEWELIPGCWLQVAEGTPSKGSGPIRLGVSSIETERNRMIKELDVDSFEIHEFNRFMDMWKYGNWGKKGRIS